VVAGSKEPTVSVIMANYNGARFLGEALASICRQSLADFELILVDDGSTDDSLAIAEAWARRDRRITLVRTGARAGPGAARNEGLRRARGAWIAVVDSDDMIAPGRFQSLAAQAQADGAQIAIDDLLIFSEDGAHAPQTLFRGDLARAPQWIAYERFVRSNRLFAAGPVLGYAKPLIARTFLARHSLSYDETMPIGEDFDLLARMMAHGARLRSYPSIGYFYRKHGASISHRLDDRSLAALSGAAARLAELGPQTPALRAAHAERIASIRSAQSYADIVEALKERRLARALALMVQNPRAALLLHMIARDRLARIVRRSGATSRPDVVVVSRQRILGRTNGNSTYLIDMCSELAREGARVRLVGPTDLTFGRWPFYALKAEMRAFEDVRLHGALRVGNVLFSRRPMTYVRAALAVLESALLSARLIKAPFTRRAPNANAAPLTRADLLFVVRNAYGARLAIADYAFAAPILPYCMSKKNAVIMHDLIFARADLFAKAGEADTDTKLAEHDELALLSHADVVIAIQDEEAGEVARRLPDVRVVTAPMAAHPARAVQTGEDDHVLFVGSNTAGNIIGLRWFFDEIWPLVRARRPEAKLTVVGTVRRGLGAPPPGVSLLGPRADLSCYYAEAGVVIAPLTVGSGLKIKLIDALARGKAVVATPVTLQGVSAGARAAVREAASPADFADAVCDLLGDRAARLELCTRALACARNDYSPQTCYAGLRELAAPA